MGDCAEEQNVNPTEEQNANPTEEQNANPTEEQKHRLNELKKPIANSTNAQENYAHMCSTTESMIKETNGYIEYLETLPFIAPENQVKVTVKFTEFKLDVLQHRNEYTSQAQNAKIEQMAQKLKDKNRTIRDLQEKLNSIKLYGVENQNSEQKIPLTTPLVVKAYSTGCYERSHCITFDEGYAIYNQLRDKIKDVFCLESDNFELKYPDPNLGAGFKQISTSDQYRDAIKITIDHQPSDIPVNVMEVYIHMDNDKDDSEVEPLCESNNDG
ncbi:hypothetical protein DFQ28_001403 [Apophysomyces sp. BC1034]|nr:hypothetical protein DFQ29_004022 [Apophysomyces sp. BC1021]KAG0190887.1 hypothetical protein DFQ28_001403 [Apophysomyces sp. BC1034]